MYEMSSPVSNINMRHVVFKSKDHLRRPELLSSCVVDANYYVDSTMVVGVVVTDIFPFDAPSRFPPR